MQANTSAGPVSLYDAATDSFPESGSLGAYGYKGYIASDASASKFLVASGTGPTYLLDSHLDILGTISGNGYGVAMKPDGSYGYRVRSEGVEILDLATLLPKGVIPIGDTPVGFHPASFPARMAMSHDGSLLAIVTKHGLLDRSCTHGDPAHGNTNTDSGPHRDANSYGYSYPDCPYADKLGKTTESVWLQRKRPVFRWS